MSKHKLLNLDYLPTPLVAAEDRAPIHIEDYSHPSTLMVILSLLGFFLKNNPDRFVSARRSPATRGRCPNAAAGFWRYLGQARSIGLVQK